MWRANLSSKSGNAYGKDNSEKLTCPGKEVISQLPNAKQMSKIAEPKC